MTEPTIFTRSFGKGPEGALCLHCALGHSGFWAAYEPLLGDRLTMRGFDMPMHGKSAGVPLDGDVHDQVTDIAAGLLQDGDHLIGHSFGATIALRLAEMFPDKVKTLTLIEPVLFAAAKIVSVQAFDDHFEQASHARNKFYEGDGLEAARLFTSIWGGGRPWEKTPQPVRDMMAKQMAFVFGSNPALMDDRAGVLKPEALAKVTMPTLLLRGSETAPVIQAVHQGLEQVLPNARDQVIEGAGHMAPMSHADDVAKAVTSMLDQDF